MSKDLDEILEIKDEKNFIAKARKQYIKQAIKDLMLDIVGEDEVPTIPINDYHWRVRNENRQQLRQKIKEL